MGKVLSVAEAKEVIKENIDLFAGSDYDVACQFGEDTLDERAKGFCRYFFDLCEENEANKLGKDVYSILEEAYKEFEE